LSIFVARILTLCDTGLILHWVNQFEADIKPCTTEDYQQRKRKDKSTLTRLTLANLAGAFAVLVIGYLISILIFLKEMIFYHCMLLEKRNKDIAAVA
jgi:ionotropic glutamate receptor